MRPNVINLAGGPSCAEDLFEQHQDSLLKVARTALLGRRHHEFVLVAIEFCPCWAAIARGYMPGVEDGMVIAVEIPEFLELVRPEGSRRPLVELLPGMVRVVFLGEGGKVALAQMRVVAGPVVD